MRALRLEGGSDEGSHRFEGGKGGEIGDEEVASGTKMASESNIEIIVSMI